MADIADLLGDELTQRRQKRDVGRVERLRELLAEKARITDERDRRMQELESLAAAARADEQRCRKELEAAIRRRVNADLERFGSNFEFRARLDYVDNQIRTLAPSVIENFKADMLKELDLTRVKLDITERASQARWFSGKKKLFTTNAKSIEERTNAIRQALIQAEELKRSPLTEGQIIDQLNSLRQSLPAITDVFHSVDPVDVTELQEWHGA